MSDLPATVTTDVESSDQPEENLSHQSTALESRQSTAAESHEFTALAVPVTMGLRRDIGLGQAKYNSVQNRIVPEIRSVDSGYNDSCSSIVSPDAEPYTSSGNASMRVGDAVNNVQNQLAARAVDDKAGSSSQVPSPSLTLPSPSSKSSQVRDVTDEEIRQLKMDMPIDLKVDYQDAMILYYEEDRDRVAEFVDAFSDISLRGKFTPLVVLYDDFAMSIGSKLKALEYGLDRCTYIFLFITEMFCKDAWSEFSSETCLMEAIHNEDKKWCVVPVFTQPKRNAKFRVPPSLNSLKGIQYWSNDKFFKDSVQRLLEERLDVRRTKERRLLSKRKDWVIQHRISKIQDQVQEQESYMNRQTQEMDARQAQEKQMHIFLEFLQSKGQSSGQAENMLQGFLEKFGVNPQFSPNMAGQTAMPGVEQPDLYRQSLGHQQYSSTQPAQSIPSCENQSVQSNSELYEKGRNINEQIASRQSAGSRSSDSFSSLPHQGSNRAASSQSSGSRSLSVDLSRSPSGQYAPTTGQYAPTTAGQYAQTTGGQYAPTTAGQYTPTTGEYTPTTEQYTPTTGQYAPTTADSISPASSQAAGTSAQSRGSRSGPTSLEHDCDPKSLGSSVFKSTAGPGHSKGQSFAHKTDPKVITVGHTADPKKYEANVETKHIHYHYHYPESNQERQPITIVGAKIVQIGDNTKVQVAGQVEDGDDRDEIPVNTDVPQSAKPEESVTARRVPPASTIFQDNSASVANRQPGPAVRPVQLPSRSQMPGSEVPAATAAVFQQPGSLQSSEVDPPMNPAGSGHAYPELLSSQRTGANSRDMAALSPQIQRPMTQLHGTGGSGGGGGGGGGEETTQVKQVVPTPRAPRLADAAAAQSVSTDRQQTLAKGNDDDADISEQTLAKIRAIESEID